MIETSFIFSSWRKKVSNHRVADAPVTVLGRSWFGARRWQDDAGLNTDDQQYHIEAALVRYRIYWLNLKYVGRIVIRATVEGKGVVRHQCSVIAKRILGFLWHGKRCIVILRYAEYALKIALRINAQMQKLIPFIRIASHRSAEHRSYSFSSLDRITLHESAER